MKSTINNNAQKSKLSGSVKRNPLRKNLNNEPFICMNCIITQNPENRSLENFESVAKKTLAQFNESKVTEISYCEKASNSLAETFIQISRKLIQLSKQITEIADEFRNNLSIFTKDLQTSVLDRLIKEKSKIPDVASTIDRSLVVIRRGEMSLNQTIKTPKPFSTNSQVVYKDYTEKIIGYASPKYSKTSSVNWTTSLPLLQKKSVKSRPGKPIFSNLNSSSCRLKPISSE